MSCGRMGSIMYYFWKGVMSVYNKKAIYLLLSYENAKSVNKKYLASEATRYLKIPRDVMKIICAYVVAPPFNLNKIFTDDKQWVIDTFKIPVIRNLREMNKTSENYYFDEIEDMRNKEQLNKFEKRNNKLKYKNIQRNIRNITKFSAKRNKRNVYNKKVRKYSANKR